MVSLETNPVAGLKLQRTPFRSATVESLYASIGSGASQVLRGQPGSGKSAVLVELKRRFQDAAFVRVSTGLDQVEAATLSLARSLGTCALEQVAEALAANPATVAPALEVMGPFLTARTLFVDDIDLLQGTGATHPLGSLRVVRSRDTAELRQWLVDRAAVVTCRRGEATSTLGALGAPPVTLHNGEQVDTAWLWEHGAGTPRDYCLVLARAVLAGEPPAEDDDLTPDAVREDVLALLPERAARALRVLALHGRPMPRLVLEALGARESDVTQLRELLLIDEVEGEPATDAGWARWLRRTMAPERLRPLHREIAEKLARGLKMSDPTWKKRADWVAEAHRHFIQSGDFHRAAEFLRFGVTLLLDDARWRSIQGDYDEAIERYHSALRIDDELRASGGDGIGARSRSYSLHYLHYNRAKRPSPEPIGDTRDAYLQSTSLWPENALFWSRTVLVQIYSGDRQAGLKSLQAAYAATCSHPLRDWVLRARTAQKLVERAAANDEPALLEAALEVWADHQASGLPRELEARDLLLESVEQGWSTKVLAPTGQPPIHLRRPVRVRVRRLSGQFVADLNLDSRTFKGRALRMDVAYREVAARLRTRTLQLLKTPSHRLDAKERLEKRGLLSVVDAVASGMLAPTGGHTWVFGVIRRDGADFVLDAGRAAGVFSVPPELATDTVVSNSWWFGRVESGPAGEPVGALTNLEPYTTDEPSALWERWRAKVADES